MTTASCVSDEARELADVAHRAMSKDVSRDARVRRYWLIDPMIVDPIETLPQPGDSQIVSIPIRHVDIAADALPYLLCAHREDSLAKLMPIYLERAASECLCAIGGGEPRARSLCGCVETTLSPDVLAKALAAAAIVLDSTRRPRIFRFWDPRVLQHIVLGGVRLDAWVAGFIGRWSFLDGFGHHRELRVGEGESDFVDRRRTLSTADERWLDELSDLNALFEMNACHALDTSEGVWSTLRESRGAPTGLRFDDRRSRLAFASMRWQSRLPIEASSRLQEILKRARESGVAIDAVLADIDDADWRLIRAQATSENHRAAASVALLSGSCE